jgi:hypothetical protein
MWTNSVPSTKQVTDSKSGFCVCYSVSLAKTRYISKGTMLIRCVSLEPRCNHFCFQGHEIHHNVTAGIILSDHSLVLQGVTRHTAGDYTCLAANTEGKGTSNPVPLRVMCEYTFAICWVSLAFAVISTVRCIGCSPIILSCIPCYVIGFPWSVNQIYVIAEKANLI